MRRGARHTLAQIERQIRTGEVGPHLLGGDVKSPRRWCRRRPARPRVSARSSQLVAAGRWRGAAGQPSGGLATGTGPRSARASTAGRSAPAGRDVSERAPCSFQRRLLPPSAQSFRTAGGGGLSRSAKPPSVARGILIGRPPSRGTLSLRRGAGRGPAGRCRTQDALIWPSAFRRGARWPGRGATVCRGFFSSSGALDERRAGASRRTSYQASVTRSWTSSKWRS